MGFGLEVLEPGRAPDSAKKGKVDFEVLARHSGHKLDSEAQTKAGARIKTSNTKAIHCVVLWCVTCDEVIARFPNPEAEE